MPGCGRDPACKDFPVIMQNLLSVCRAVQAHVGGTQNFGVLEPHSLRIEIMPVETCPPHTLLYRFWTNDTGVSREVPKILGRLELRPVGCRAGLTP